MAKIKSTSSLRDKPDGTKTGSQARNGEEAEVLATENNWTKVKLTGPAREGWVKSDTVDAAGVVEIKFEDVRDELAETCVSQALFVGMNAHFLLAVAQLRSGRPPAQGEVGLYRLTTDQWNAALGDTEFKLDYPADRIKEPDFQCGALAVLAFREQEKFFNATPESAKKLPSSVQLYKALWPKDTAQFPADMQKALDATAAAIRTAAPLVTGDVVADDSVLKKADDPASPTNPRPKSAIGSFEELAPKIMEDLIKAFDLNVRQAAAILGNLGHESAGFRLMQEVKPLIPGSAGGYGWAQWTGPRRQAFFQYCEQEGLDKDDYKANLGYLKKELDPVKGSEKGAIPALKAAGDEMAEMVRVFEMKFERASPNHKGYPNRNVFAQKALNAYNATHRA